MALYQNDSARTPLLDDNMSAAVRRRLTEMWGVTFLALALALGAALWSYNLGDPSPFSATAQPALNLLGTPGAMVADTLIRHIGLGAWAIVLFLAVWGIRFVFHMGEERIWARLLALVPYLALAPLFASTHAVFDSWQLTGTGMGGALGDAGARILLDMIPMADAGAIIILSLGLGLMLLIVGAIALGLTMGEASALFTWLWGSLSTVCRVFAGRTWRAGRAGSTAAAARYREWRTRPRSETMAPADPTIGWRARMSGLKVPSLRRNPASDTSDARLEATRTSLIPGRKARVEPELSMDRITGLDDEFEQPDEPEAPQTSMRALVGRLSEEEARTGLTAVEPEVAAPAPPIERAPVAPPRKSQRAKAEAEPKLALEATAATEFVPPPLALLQKPVSVVRGQTSDTALEDNARMLETVLEDYGVRGEIVAVRPGPVVTLYELEPAPGLKASRVIGLADDIARSMSALAARVSTVPGRSIIGIELPNQEREKVWLRDTFERREYGDAKYALALALGKDISGAPIIANLAKMPHLLIAGTTGSGKSVAINTMILSLLYRLTPEQCRLIMIDPKMLELSVYDNIPHLLAPVVTDPKKAIVALKWVVAEMEERYRKMSKMGVRNIDGYNARVRDAIAKGEDFSRTVQTGFDEATGEPIYETETFAPEEMPFIVVIVDEMADLMMVAGKEIEACIQRLAQMARASGIHLIMATQRPSVDVITGTIKANFPTRISFQVTSKIDSRTILGEQGAEQLLGMGDMLFMEGGGRIQRVHGPFVSDEEVEEVVSHLKQQGTPSYVNAVTDGVDDEAQALVDQKLGLAPAGNGEDALYDQAVAIVARDRKCSTSYIQRKLAIGYNKAARLVEQMEDQGIVTSANAVGKREILIEER